MLTQTLAFVAAIVLGLTFLASSVSKLRDPGAFVIAVLDYQVLPPALAVAYGRMLPLAELVCGLALVAGVWPIDAGLLSAALVLSFMVAVAINLVRGRRLDCHCFGSKTSEPLGWTTVVRLCVLLACAALVAGWRGRAFLARPPADPVPAVLLALSIVLGLYLLSAVPALWRVWHTPLGEHVRVSSRRVSLRDLPLERDAAEPSPAPIETVQRR